MLKDAVGVDAELVEGARGEFSIRLGERIVAQKSPRGFPPDAEIVARVKEALGG